MWAIASPSGDLRPDWRKRGFLRAYSDQRFTFARYFSPLEPNRPKDLDALFAHNDVLLFDRQSDPGEMNNLATDPADTRRSWRSATEARVAHQCRDRQRPARLGDREAATSWMAHLARRFCRLIRPTSSRIG